ncbi:MULTISPECIES: energy-coupling factor transporter transmembrane component T [unclassified Brenneria]|uniref:energy-coupling factor transporter transmembrane component T family protein n=1 Tax=unclassified Brenneria TaxID=2634434 RepID=UPI0029C34C7E|nr:MULTISPECIES: energy-coupling factor transporter transmembrane component T [unclassified Brenneria]MDX5627022.1 energy-coupling factor transporter transmembrane component T [Brenneria sp. L3-3Z]MDX5693628.1 energy-coupling factor transporter transmembrane component T [Brenneria sp. L4-2C]MEE3661732.1 energy-coupling factor transporter transmembrane component T [Brenneria sp. g21c3]
MSNAYSLLYQQQSSWLDRRDPRMKIIAVLLAGTALLLTQHPGIKTLQILLLLTLWGIARLPWKMLLLTLLSLSMFFVSTMIYQAMLTPLPGEELVTWGGITFSSPGAWRGVMMCEQIAGIVLLLALLVRTTAPVQLAEGLEILLGGLKKWRFPVHEAVMMFSIALRFLPGLLEEFDKIRKAQLARGGGFHRKNLFIRFQGVFPMLMPLFVTSILRAKDLAVAMESRGYRGDEGRTPIRIYRFNRGDYALLACAALELLAAIVWR